MSNKNKQSDESIVQAARISAKSAAMVALMTTIGGALAGLLRPSEGNNKPIAQLHWIKIERIESTEFMMNGYSQLSVNLISLKHDS